MLALLPLLLAAAPVTLTVHVAHDDAGTAVIDDTWIDAQIELAGARLAGGEVSFDRADGGGDAVPPELLTVKQRNQLATLAPADGTVHVFVVTQIADKDHEGAFIGGVTWRYGGGKKRLRGRRYLILSASGARVDTLAHELGHFFGLPHGEDEDDLMTAPGRDEGATLDDDQLAIVKRRARKWRKRS